MLNQNLLLTGDDGYNLTKSLRFRSSASAYLNRTPASAGNRKTWTWSGWIKRGTLGVSQYFFSGGTGGSDTTQTGINFLADNKLNWLGGSGTQYRTTTQVFRDPSAWYHIVLAFDTTLATANDRIKIYVNGTQITAFDNLTNPTQNLDYGVNQAQAHNIGRWTGASGYFDGYLAEVNFIDGQALTPSSFGETSTTTGVWIPKKYTGTYGTNGFYLPFTDTTSTSTLGTDFSGNSNTWTVNNISLTSGSTYDSINDVPTLTSATTANYAVLNSISSNASLTLTNANLSTPSNQDNKANNGTIGVSTGKWYWEVIVNNNSSICPYIGVTSRSQENDPDISPTVSTAGRSLIRLANPYSYKNYTATSNVNGATNQGTTGTIGVALNLDIGEIKFYNNNTLFHTDTTIPTNGTVLFPYIGLTNSGLGGWNSTAFNFGQQPFAYTPPTGFVALNTFNLPTPTIGATASSQANKYFNAITYTGNGAASSNTTQNITTTFYPDLTWVKGRDSAFFHRLTSTGLTQPNYLSTNSTDAEGSVNDTISALASTYFQVKAAGTGGTNQSGSTYVGWTWNANSGSTVTNTAGSITSTVSANTTAGFSIVTYTGNGSNSTVGHGLGVAPSMVIVKRRPTAGSNWAVWHTGIANTEYLLLNSTIAKTTNTAFWNSTSPTSTVFSVGSDPDTNGTVAIVAYCFAPVAGYSAFGSYTGNGSTDGTFVFTGFRPRFVMTKKSSSTGGWGMVDTSINPYNQATTYLQANTSNATVGGTSANGLDFVSNGFKIRSTDASFNETNGDTYIYMAFAENPFKYSLAR